jgi:hypothetical protein
VTQRFDELTAPPVAGQHYLVWCVRGTWDGKKNRWWPIWGPLHEDTKWINFKLPHWHLNRFFVADDDQYRATGMPFHGVSVKENEPLPAPVLRRIKCRRSLAYPFPTYKAPATFAAMQTHFAGQQCKRGHGWICPHKGFDLGAIAPRDDGTIACPLHGIQIHALTGVVLP